MVTKPKYIHDIEERRRNKDREGEREIQRGGDSERYRQRDRKKREIDPADWNWIDQSKTYGRFGTLMLFLRPEK